MHPGAQDVHRRKICLNACPLKRVLRSVGDGLNALKISHPTLAAALKRSCSAVRQRSCRIFCVASSTRFFDRPSSLSARPNLAEAGFKTVAPDTASRVSTTCFDFVNWSSNLQSCGSKNDVDNSRDSWPCPYSG